MSKPFLRRVVAFTSLTVFVFLIFLAAVPHTHSGVMGPKPHDCSICRAQSVQPLVEPMTLLGSITLAFFWLSLCLAGPLLVDERPLSPESRAPPVVA